MLLILVYEPMYLRWMRYRKYFVLLASVSEAPFGMNNVLCLKKVWLFGGIALRSNLTTKILTTFS